MENNILKEISNKIGHYGPSQLMNDQSMHELKDRGLSDYELSSSLRTVFDNYSNDGFIDLQSNREQSSVPTEYIPKYWWKND